jgi:NADP-dependent 3-hydroxy acid dehydrogenase YdfG
VARAEITMAAHDEPRRRVRRQFRYRGGGCPGDGRARVADCHRRPGSRSARRRRGPSRSRRRYAAVDAGDRDAVGAFFADLPSDVDHLVLSFSTGRADGPFRDLPMADLSAAIDGKLVAYLSVLQAALPRLRADGSVTLVGAGSAKSALPATAGLAAVNGGLHAAVLPLAVELAPPRVMWCPPG